MSTYGPYHRLGSPGGPGCKCAAMPVQGKASDGTVLDEVLLDAGPDSSELELLRTVAAGLGVQWGHDDFGWWAAVPSAPVSKSAIVGPQPQEAGEKGYSLFREDDNGARFLIERFNTQEEAEAKAAELARGGHKQHYFVETPGM